MKPEYKYIVTSNGNNWGIVNINTHRFKVVGPIGHNRKNYFEEARELAAQRMRCPLDKVQYIPNYFAKVEFEE